MDRPETPTTSPSGARGITLAKRQRDRALTLALQRMLRKGTPPDRARVAEEFAKELPEILGEPFFELVEQARRGQFRVDWQNTMFDQARIDLRLLFDQDVEVVELLLGHLALAEVTGRRMGLEIRALQGLLEDLLLTTQRATGFFYTAYDTFTDLSKVDQAQSDVAADLESGLITLVPETSTKRIPLAHLLTQVSAPITLVQPADAQLQLAPGSRFGNAFEDLLTAWQHQVLTRQQQTVEVAVTIPVVDPLADVPGEEITRIQLHPIGGGQLYVLPLWARDGVAFSRFAGISEPVLVEDDVVTIDVPPTVVTALQLRLKKTAPDGEEEQAVPADVGSGRQRLFSTSFGFRQISVWKMGYKRSGTLISKVLTPEDADEAPNISKISLNTDEIVPEGTRIDYAVATAEAPTSFIPITPLSREDGEAPKVVDFATTQRSGREENAFTIDAASPATSLATIRGVEYFSVRSVLDASIFKSARLWRGKNAWHCQRAVQSNIRAVRNLYVDFSRLDVQRLYVFEENERIAAHPSNDGTAEIELQTRFPILLESDEFQAAQDLLRPTDVARPVYSVRRLLRRPVAGTLSSTATGADGDLTLTARAERASTDVASQSSAPTAGRQGAQIQIANFAGASLVPTPAGGSGIVPDLIGIPFRLSYTVNSVPVAGTFTTLSAQLEADGTLTLTLEDPTELIRTATGTLAALSAAWEILATDMTSSIRGVVGNMVKISRDQKLATEDLVEISYRRGLLPTEIPVTSSVIVKATTDDSTVYQQGRDYTLDLQSRTIARIPTGTIGTGVDQSAQAIRIDFDFEEQLLGLVTYRTFLFNSAPTPKLTLEKIQVDRENGEQVLLETSGGFLDLHDRDDLPPLPAGWHQLVVRSDPVRNPDGSINKLSAIYKAINLKEQRNDADAGRFLLPAEQHPDATAETTDKFAHFFARQVAFLQPMQQVTFQQLTTGIRKTDRTVFAIKPAATEPVSGADVLVLNYDPGTTGADLLYFPPDVSGSGLPLAREDFEFEYAFLPADVTTLTGLILRATLHRSPDAEGSLTPILRRYTLRFSY